MKRKKRRLLHCTIMIIVKHTTNYLHSPLRHAVCLLLYVSADLTYNNSRREGGGAQHTPTATTKARQRKILKNRKISVFLQANKQASSLMGMKQGASVYRTTRNFNQQHKTQGNVAAPICRLYFSFIKPLSRSSLLAGGCFFLYKFCLLLLLGNLFY